MKIRVLLAASASLLATAFTVPVAAQATPSTQTRAAAVAVTDACGPQPLKADGTPWKCTFNDEFNGTTLDRTKWMPQTIFSTGTSKTYACYLDDPANVSVSDGNLNLTLRKVTVPAPCAGTTNTSVYTSGSVSTYRLFSQQYGRFEARMKNTETRSPGLQEAFWLWPDDRYSKGVWPAAGEIDVAETYSSQPDLAIPFLHYTAWDNFGPRPGLNTAWNCAASRGVYNTYTLEWSATQLKILVNGTTCLVNKSGNTAFKKRYIIAFTQAIGADGNEYDGRAPLPATTSVDYIRVWQ